MNILSIMDVLSSCSELFKYHTKHWAFNEHKISILASSFQALSFANSIERHRPHPPCFLLTSSLKSSDCFYKKIIFIISFPTLWSCVASLVKLRTHRQEKELKLNFISSCCKVFLLSSREGLGQCSWKFWSL